MQVNLDAEAKNLDFLLVEKEQLDKQFAKKEAVDMKELQKIIIIIRKLENELLMLEAKEKALINNDEDFLNDTGIIQVELCVDEIPQFESIFKDPNDFPYLSSLKKIEDEKMNKTTSLKTVVVSKPPVLQDKNDEIKLKESNKNLEKIRKTPKNSKVAPRIQEVSIIDKLPVKNSRKRSVEVSEDTHHLSSIDNVKQQMEEPVVKSSKTVIEPIIISS